MNLIGPATAIAVTLATIGAAMATCGDNGGPGYRGPNGQCVGWKQLKSVCGTPPTTKCTPESVSPLVGADEKKAKK